MLFYSKKNSFAFFSLITSLWLSFGITSAQNKPIYDSILVKSTSLKDSLKTQQLIVQDSVAYKKRLRSPRKASLYSALLPGLGQIYNRKYWKLPFVYGAAIGVGAVINFNHTQYQQFRRAFEIKVYNESNPSTPIFDAYPLVPRQQIQQVRNTAQQNLELSIIIAAVIYGLNILDATVDAHLSGFDVSENLSLQWHSPTNTIIGLGLTYKLNNEKNPNFY